MREIAKDIIAIAAAKNIAMATAESCTGGMVAAALTDIAGASAVFERGFITYSNDAKIALGVDAGLLRAHGAVSRKVAHAMAQAALDTIKAHEKRIAISITGIAGPGGGSAAKPVGLVWFGIAAHGLAKDIEIESFQFEGGREAIRKFARDHALRMLLAHL